MAYLNDQDPGLLTQDPTLVPPAPAVGVSDPEALKKQLYSNLLAQLNKPDPLASQRKDLANQNRDNAFLASIQQSANQLGTIGGKTASAAPLNQLAGSLAQAGQEDLSNEQQALSNKDKVQNYLLGQLDKSDNLKAQIAARQQAQTAALAQQAQLAGDKLDYKRQSDRQHAELMQAMQGQKLEASNGGKDDSQFQKLAHDINPGLAGSRSDFGKQQAMISSADRVLTLGHQVAGQPGGADPRQIHELAIASAGLVSGGGTGAAQSTIEALVPRSFGGTAAGIEEWLTSNPTGTNQQAFVHRMLETADREKAMAVDKVKTIQSGVLQSYAHLKNKDPDRYGQIQQMYFGQNAQFDPSGKYVSAAPPGAPAASPEAGTAMAGTGAVDPKITDYAKQHNLDYGGARSILVGRGYKPNEQ